MCHWLKWNWANWAVGWLVATRAHRRLPQVLAVPGGAGSTNSSNQDVWHSHHSSSSWLRRRSCSTFSTITASVSFFFIVLTICCCCCVLTVELSKMSCNTKNDFFRLTPICRPSHQRQIPLNSAYRVESLLLPVVHCSSSLNFSRSRRPAILLRRVELAIQQHQQAGWQHNIRAELAKIQQ